MTTDSYRRLIALDFDGVLHSYTSPWTDAATISDPPTPGAMAFLRSLVDDGRFDVVIVSSRLSSDDGEQAILVWLETHVADLTDDETAEVIYSDGTPPGSIVIDRTPIDRRTVDRIMRGIRFSSTRPPAFLTIDDRGWQFDGTWPDLDAIAAFKPWNKRPAVEKESGFGSAGYDYLADFDKWRDIIGASCTVFQGEFLIEMDVALREYVELRDSRKDIARLLAFAADRLVHVHGDKENVDFIRAMREAVDRLAPPLRVVLSDGTVEVVDGRTA